MEAFIASRAAKCSFREASEPFSYKDADVALLLEPTAAVLAKRMPEGTQWAEEMTLALYLVAVHQQKVAAFVESQEIKRKVRQMPNPAESEKAVV